MTTKHLLTILLAAAVCAATSGHAEATTFKTYITGEIGTGPAAPHVIFTVTFDPATPFSGTIVSALVDTEHRLDGIDFLPGSGETKVVAAGTYLAPAMDDGFVGIYDPASPDPPVPLVLKTNFAPGMLPGGTPIMTHPSTVKATPTHIYYTENQFGFKDTDPHRIIRVPVGGGPPEVVFDGADVGPPLIEFEGIEIVDDRLYFFANDPGASDKRALMRIGLVGGVWDTFAPEVLLPGLSRGASSGSGPGYSDGSDELDFDPVTGLIWGTNIITGELIAFDPFDPSPGGFGAIVVTEAEVDAGGPGGLGLLDRSIDGIRSTGEGHLVFTGLEGVIGSIDLKGFIDGGGLAGPSGSITDAHVFALLDAPGDFAFDDLTSLAVVIPEPSTFLPALLGLAGLLLWRRRG